MNKQQLIEQIKLKKTFLCVGLDTDVTKIPSHITAHNNMFEFNKHIIDATQDVCVSYKINTAFYESQGLYGWQQMELTVQYLKANYPNHFIIADAKRGDIGNTSKMYAEAFLNKLNMDSITVAPYMGEDSVKPFLEFKNKWAIVLALTSNIGADDFQLKKSEDKFLYQQVLETSMKWGSAENMMYVVGATRPEMFAEIRKIIPYHFILVPGVGAQGGSLSEVCKYGMNKDCGLLINASRSIIYASTGENFAQKAREEAMKIQKEMQPILEAAIH